MPLPRYPVLTSTQLNRATVARQLLLEPGELDVVEAIERVGGLQAQEPASPYLALRARLRDFDTTALDAAFRGRRVVKATLMRVTVHAVSRNDYLRFLPALQPMLRAGRRGRAPDFDDALIEHLAEEAMAFASEPRANNELRDYLGELSGQPGEDIWWRVRRFAPFVHVPSEAAWSFGRRPSLISAQSWLEEPFPPADDALRYLAMRYLGAFGPASAADIATWSGLGVTVLRRAITALDAEGALERFSDESGRELLDLAGAPRPDAGTPLPPILLPMWDSLLLGHADRSRVLAPGYRARVIQRNGDVLPTFLVDGRVAGLWWAEDDGGRTRIVLEPFEVLSRTTLRAVERAAEPVARFVEPHEPAVYARYRWDRTRSPL